MASAITTNATTLEGQLLEIVTKMQNLERGSTNNPQAQNRVSGTFNIDNGTFIGSFTLALTQNIVNGKVELTAQEYLVD